MDAEDIDAIAAVLSALAALAWPAVVLIFILTQQQPLTNLLKNLKRVKGFGLEAELQEVVDDEAQRLLARPGKAGNAPTAATVLAAQQVNQVARSGSLGAVYRQIQDLAREYEGVRAALPAGDVRTRQMELIVTKMRTLAIAAFPLLDQLKQSASPGERLAAVEILQVVPDPDSLAWLAERLKVEKPFIGYHAAVALAAAARGLDEATVRADVKPAIEAAIANLGPGKDETDRAQTLKDALKTAVARSSP